MHTIDNAALHKLSGKKDRLVMTGFHLNIDLFELDKQGENQLQKIKQQICPLALKDLLFIFWFRNILFSIYSYSEKIIYFVPVF